MPHRLQRFIFAMWVILVPIVVVLSLHPKAGPPVGEGFDLAFHFLAYVALAGLPFLATAEMRSAWTLALSMLPLGLILESLQYWIPGRYADPWDAVANVLGVAIGCLAGRAARKPAGIALGWLSSRRS